MNYPIELQDKFRSTEGIAQYKRQTYLAGAVKAPKVVSVRILLKPLSHAGSLQRLQITYSVDCSWSQSCA